MYFNKFSQLVFLSGFAMAAVFVTPNRAQAGLLSDFEHEATQSSPEGRHRANNDHDHDDDIDYGEFIGSCLGAIFNTLADSEADSWKDSAVELDVPERPVELEPVTAAALGSRPWNRFDYGYQDVEGDVSAHDFRIEIGWSRLGLQIRETHYQESIPDDDLDLIQAHFLLRSASEYLDIDLGVGLLNLYGNESHISASLTLPLALHAHKHLDIEFRPSWGLFQDSTIGDYDLAVSLGWHHVALRGGYRWMIANNQSLNGPYLGLSLSY